MASDEILNDLTYVAVDGGKHEYSARTRLPPVAWAAIKGDGSEPSKTGWLIAQRKHDAQMTIIAAAVDGFNAFTNENHFYADHAQALVDALNELDYPAELRGDQIYCEALEAKG